ncbi:oligosaccharide flippase family protein [Hydrogenoanaerobacterium sp.]|uniref:oligosaccharide flippase family protein n=1 Tax=Hydrogenoanaerobacterium sp. TaxID=2953763 RepID=UPI002897F600|nr:oligosaccharide flippase family protein [Hydrogenoanaerobacterium sp.]
MMQRAKSLLKNVAKSSFLRNFGVLLSGSVVAQALPVLASPLLARLYTPAQFGEYALFVSAVNILSQLVCLKYDFAILTARTDEEAASLFRLCFALSIVLSLAIALALPFAGNISATFGVQSSGWLYFLPLGSFFTGMHSALTYYNTRLLRYRRITAANIFKSLTMVAVQLVLFYVGLGAFALTVGQTIAYGVACLLMWRKVAAHCRNHTQAKQGFQQSSAQPDSTQLPALSLRAVARRYDAFPKYTLPGALCNTAAFSSISFFLAAFYSAQQLGYYSLINRVLAVPLTLISTTTGQIFTKELTDTHQNSGDVRKVFWRVTAALAAVSLPMFALLFIIASPLVRLVFGAQWEQSAVMLRILIPLFAVRFLVSPISSTGIVLGRQMPTMLWQSSLLIAAVLPAVFYIIKPLTLNAYLILQTILLTACYLIFLTYAAKLVKRRRKC